MKSSNDRDMNDNCMERCRFKTENCWMSADGTWDCSTRSGDCEQSCRFR
jgi:hypothetical protein